MSNVSADKVAGRAMPPPPDRGLALAHDEETYNEPFAMVYRWTWDVPLDLCVRGLYCYLLDCSGQKQRTWRSRKTLAEKLRISVRSLHTYLHELEHHGLIRIENRQRENKPSIIHICKKFDVMARQSLLQNLHEVEPLAKSAAPPLAKSAVPLVQDLQEEQDRGEKDTTIEQDKDSCAAPAAVARPQTKRRLHQEADPRATTARDAAIAYWAKLTGQQIRGDTRKDAAACVSAYGLADTLGAIDALWHDPFWRKGNLRFSTIMDRVESYRRGDLGPPTCQLSQPPAAADMAVGVPEESPANAWEVIKDAVKHILSGDNYARWFAPTRLQDRDPDGTLVISAPSDLHVHWLGDRLAPRLMAASRDANVHARWRFVVVPAGPDDALPAR